jgi:cytidine deaminase
MDCRQGKVVMIEIEKDKTATVKEILTRHFVVDCEVTTASGEVYRGVLIEKDSVGNITLEIKPGVIKTLRARDIRTVMPITEKPAPKSGNK